MKLKSFHARQADNVEISDEALVVLLRRIAATNNCSYVFGTDQGYVGFLTPHTPIQEDDTLYTIPGTDIPFVVGRYYEDKKECIPQISLSPSSGDFNFFLRTDH